MKAVVVEIKNKKAAVLSDNGCVVTVKNNGYEIGQVIQMTNSRVQFTKKVAVLAASAAAFIILGTGAWAYATPYSYVSLDVNPSIEYTINRFDRVLSVKAVNDDGEEILQQIALDDLENHKIDVAILKTVEQFTAAGYFKEGSEGSIVITAASEDANKANTLANDLLLTVEEEVTEAQQVVVVEAFSIGLNRVEEAKVLGVTPGKLNLVEKLQASATDPDTINIEVWLNKSVKDIIKATKDNREASVVSGSAIAMDDKAIEKVPKEQEKDEEKSIKKSEAAQKNDNKADNSLIDKDNKKSSDQKDKAEKKSDAKQEKSSKKDNATLKKEKEKINSSDKASAIQEKDKQGTSKKPSIPDKKEKKDKSEDKKIAKSDQDNKGNGKNR